MKKGYIYLITNKLNNKQYVGQTARDVETRFLEHCSETRGHSKLHNAIQKYGWQNFKVETLEEVSLTELDEREIYWINKLQTRDKGYNIAPGGITFCAEYPQVQVVENGLIFDSKEDLGRLMSQVTSWNIGFIKDKIRSIINTDKAFLGYHFIHPEGHPAPSDTDVLIDWIKTLNIQHQGKHIYSIELEKEFDTIAAAAQYLIENKLYVTQSKTPIQSVVTAISKQLRGKTDYINGAQGPLHFEYVPGATTKQKGSSNIFSTNKVYCPQLDKTFNSQIEAANYMIDNNIWTGIKLKTAKLRISDIVRGAFPDYKGYTFIKV